MEVEEVCHNYLVKSAEKSLNFLNSSVQLGLSQYLCRMVFTVGRDKI